MKYKIDKIEHTTTGGGKPYARLECGDKKGSIWDNYSDLKVGDEIEGDFITNDKGFTNFKRFMPLQRPKFMGNAGIAKAQETKREDIKDAQERKNDAIARAGAFRDATLVALASLKDQPFPNDADFKREWEAWVKYFLGKSEEPFV